LDYRKKFVGVGNIDYFCGAAEGAFARYFLDYKGLGDLSG